MTGVARTSSVALRGIEGSIVEVEADISAQLPAFVIIGLPDTALGEARDRVRSASINAGCPLPPRRLTVNLSPANLPKHGSAFDLAIALACLAAAKLVKDQSIAEVVHLGELGLDGRLRPIEGVLPAVLAAVRAGFHRVMVPAANAAEARLVPGAEVIPIISLLDAAIWHGGKYPHRETEMVEQSQVLDLTATETVGDLADIVGNDAAITALSVAAAGGHHMFLLGPPGAGKTMLASRLPGILPDLDPEAAIEVSSIRSLSGARVGQTLAVRPPFEAPHHTASAAAIVGGGRIIRPGAIARASHGVLFLDEAPEFAPSVLDVLRQPLESGTIRIERANSYATFTAKFQLVLAANPCPCGGGDGVTGAESCACSASLRRRYLGRISGPLLDRIDVRVWVPRISSVVGYQSEKMAVMRTVVNTQNTRYRVLQARQAARERLRNTPWRTNNEVSGTWLRGEGRLHPGNKATAIIDRALERGGITMRGYDRVLKVAWTVADIAGATAPGAEHIGRALFLRKGMEF